MLKFKLTGNGGASVVRIEPVDGETSEMATCQVDAATTWVFPPNTSSDEEISFPLKF